MYARFHSGALGERMADVIQGIEHNCMNFTCALSKYLRSQKMRPDSRTQGAEVIPSKFHRMFLTPSEKWEE
jgi:hypothetical protein